MLNEKDLLALAEQLQNSRWVDLSHTLEEGVPAWLTHARFGQVLYESYELGAVARHYGLALSEHTGTHMDAPLHFIPEGPAHYGIDEVPLSRLAGRAAMIEAPELPPGGLLTTAHVREWEEEHGQIQERDKVLIRYSRTGRASVGMRRSIWSRRGSRSWVATPSPSTPSALKSTRHTTPCLETRSTSWRT